MSITEELRNFDRLLGDRVLEKNSVWVLFVLEDMREHFKKTHNGAALQVIENAIKALESVLIQ